MKHDFFTYLAHKTSHTDKRRHPRRDSFWGGASHIVINNKFLEIFLKLT